MYELSGWRVLALLLECVHMQSALGKQTSTRPSQFVFLTGFT